MKRYELGDTVTIHEREVIRRGDFSFGTMGYAGLSLEVFGIIRQNDGTRVYKLKRHSGDQLQGVFRAEMFQETGPSYSELKPIFNEEVKEIPE